MSTARNFKLNDPTECIEVWDAMVYALSPSEDKAGPECGCEPDTELTGFEFTSYDNQHNPEDVFMIRRIDNKIQIGEQGFHIASWGLIKDYIESMASE